jgi:hypothetical protein
MLGDWCQLFGGYPWEPKVKEILARESPINYVQNITTPSSFFSWWKR